MDEARLNDLDAVSWEPLKALGLAEERALPAGGSLANPRPFVCAEGIFWLKSQAQYGLAPELIAGRLADSVGAGPLAAVVTVPAEALPKDGSANHLEGVVVGIRDVPETINGKDSQFSTEKVDARSRAGVIVFQTWVGGEDLQVLVNLATGTVSSIDHGGCFGSVEAPAPPSVIVTPLPGADEGEARSAEYVEPMVAAITKISDEALLEAVARVPDEERWRAESARRLQIAEWLAFRRDRLEGVMSAWQM